MEFCEVDLVFFFVRSWFLLLVVFLLLFEIQLVFFIFGSLCFFILPGRSFMKFCLLFEFCSIGYHLVFVHWISYVLSFVLFLVLVFIYSPLCFSLILSFFYLVFYLVH